ncbi:MAG: hypothetical protein ACO3FQ_05245 [Terrimicrobiaceae bacterium]
MSTTYATHLPWEMGNSVVFAKIASTPLTNWGNSFRDVFDA